VRTLTARELNRALLARRLLLERRSLVRATLMPSTIHLVHDRRAGVLSEDLRRRIFSSRSPHSFPTFLVGGRVAGTRKHERGAIRLEPFGRLDAAARREPQREADRLAEFHA